MAKPDDAFNPTPVGSLPCGPPAPPIPGILYTLDVACARVIDDNCHLLTITGAIPATPRLRYERYWLAPGPTATDNDYNEFMAFRCLLELHELDAIATLGPLTALVVPMRNRLALRIDESRCNQLLRGLPVARVELRRMERVEEAIDHGLRARDETRQATEAEGHHGSK